MIPFSDIEIEERVTTLKKLWNISIEEVNYFVSSGRVENQPYVEKGIMLKSKSGELIDFAKANDNLTIESLSRNVVKYFLCYPKDMPERDA